MYSPPDTKTMLAFILFFFCSELVWKIFIEMISVNVLLKIKISPFETFHIKKKINKIYLLLQFFE